MLLLNELDSVSLAHFLFFHNDLNRKYAFLDNLRIGKCGCNLLSFHPYELDFEVKALQVKNHCFRLHALLLELRTKTLLVKFDLVSYFGPEHFTALAFVHFILHYCLLKLLTLPLLFEVHYCFQPQVIELRVLLIKQRV